MNTVDAVVSILKTLLEGALFGLLPLLIAKRRNRKPLGVIAMTACVILALFKGEVIAAIGAFIFVSLVFLKRRDTVAMTAALAIGWFALGKAFIIKRIICTGAEIGGNPIILIAVFVLLVAAALLVWMEKRVGAAIAVPVIAYVLFEQVQLIAFFVQGKMVVDEVGRFYLLVTTNLLFCVLALVANIVLWCRLKTEICQKSEPQGSKSVNTEDHSVRPRQESIVKDFKFSCPHCSQHLEAPPEMFGTVIACPSCKKQIQVPQPAPVSIPPPLPPVISAPPPLSPVIATSQKTSGKVHKHKWETSEDAWKCRYCNTQNVNERDEYGYTPLHQAARAGSLELIRKLILAGSDVNATSEGCKNTALHEVRDGDCVMVARLLISSGADLFAINVSGRTPRKLAEEHAKDAQKNILDCVSKIKEHEGELLERRSSPVSRDSVFAFADRGAIRSTNSLLDMEKERLKQEQASLAGLNEVIAFLRRAETEATATQTANIPPPLPHAPNLSRDNPAPIETSADPQRGKSEAVTIKSLGSNDECLVMRFATETCRDEAFEYLWNLYATEQREAVFADCRFHGTEPSHFEKRTSLTSGGINYGRRGSAEGAFLIVKAPCLCGDTWHCIEFKKIHPGYYDEKTNTFHIGVVGDGIDKVAYYEVANASFAG